MNIVIFTEIKSKGGLDTFLVNLVNNWPNSTDDLTIYCNNDHPEIYDLKNKINRKVLFKAYTYSKFISFLSHLSTNHNKNTLIKIFYRIIELPIIYPYFILFLCTKIFYDKKYDRLLIVNGGYPGSLICRAAPPAWFLNGHKGKVFFNFHNFCEPTPFYGFYEFFIDFLVKKFTNKFISVSKLATNSIMNRRIFYSSKKLTIYNGVNDFYKKKPIKVITNEKYCLMLSRLHPDKGHLFLISSFRLVVNVLPSAKLLIFGNGSIKYKNELIRFIEENKLSNNISIFPAVSNVSDVLKGSVMLIAPSICNESFNYTIIEAMCCKKPVIVTNYGAMPEVIGNSGAGFVVPVNKQILSNKIIELLEDSDLSEKMGCNGRKFFEKTYKASLMSMSYHNAIM